MTVNAKVASAYVDLVARTEAFHKALNDAKNATREWSAQMREESQKSRESMRLLSEELGLHIPRGLQNIMSKLPGLSTALNAAFDSVVVLTLVKLVVEAGEKIYEFGRKGAEAARKNVEAWAAVSTPLANINTELTVQNSRLQDSIAKLEKKPGDGLKTMLLEAADAAQKLGDKLKDDIDKMSRLAVTSKMQAAEQLLGAKAPTGDVDRSIQWAAEKFKEVTSEYEDVKNRAAASGNWDNYREQSKLEIQTLQKEVGPSVQYLMDYLRNQQNLKQVDADGPNRSENIAKASGAVNTFLGAFSALEQQYALDSGKQQEKILGNAAAASAIAAEAANAALAKLKEHAAEILRFFVGKPVKIPEAGKEAMRLNNEPITASAERNVSGEMQDDLDRTGPRWRQYNEEVAKGSEENALLAARLEETRAKMDLATGAIGPHQAAVLVAAAHVQMYKVELAELGEQLSKIAQDTSLTDEQRAAGMKGVQNQIDRLGGEQKIQALSDAVDQFQTTWKGMVQSIFDEVVKRSQDTAQQVRQISMHILDGLNTEMAKGMTGQKMDFGKVFQGGAQQLATSGLEKLEGLLVGGAKMGTRGNPMIVKDVDAPAGGAAARSVGGGLMGMLNNSDWASSLFGGRLFGSGSFFGGGHALGGPVMAGVPIDVGELGRERFVPQVPGRIVPNRDLGGGPLIGSIDARGTDPALTRANFERALQQTHAAAVQDASRAMAERQRRMPQ